MWVGAHAICHHDCLRIKKLRLSGLVASAVTCGAVSAWLGLLLFPDGKEIRLFLISPSSLITSKNVVNVSSPWHLKKTIFHYRLVLVLASPTCNLILFLLSFLLLLFLFFSLSPFKARSYSRSRLAWNHYRQESANLPFPNVPPAPQCSDHRWVPPGLPHPILHGAQPSPPPSDLPQRLRLAARLGKGRGAEGVEPWSSCMIPGAEDPFLKWSP